MLRPTRVQPNLLPGASVLSKLEMSDICIWLDEVQYSKNGFTNRNKMPDGSWFTVPVDKSTDGEAINRVRIAAEPWRGKAKRTLNQHFADQDWCDQVVETILRPYGLLCGLNLALLRIVLDRLEGPEWVFQSHLDGGHAVMAVSDHAVELAPISYRLAMMVAEVGGDIYLSGPSGRNYLDEQPFHALGLKVSYWKHEGANPSALEYLALKEKHEHRLHVA